MLVKSRNWTTKTTLVNESWKHFQSWQRKTERLVRLWRNLTFTPLMIVVRLEKKIDQYFTLQKRPSKMLQNLQYYFCNTKTHVVYVLQKHLWHYKTCNDNSINFWNASSPFFGPDSILYQIVNQTLNIIKLPLLFTK